MLGKIQYSPFTFLSPSTYPPQKQIKYQLYIISSHIFNKIFEYNISLKSIDENCKLHLQRVTIYHRLMTDVNESSLLIFNS